MNPLEFFEHAKALALINNSNELFNIRQYITDYPEWLLPLFSDKDYSTFQKCVTESVDKVIDNPVEVRIKLQQCVDNIAHKIFESITQMELPLQEDNISTHGILCPSFRRFRDISETQLQMHEKDTVNLPKPHEDKELISEVPSKEDTGDSSDGDWLEILFPK